MTLQMVLNGRWLGERSALLLVHGGVEDTTLTLPTVPGLTAYQLMWDSAWERPQPPGEPQPPGPVAVSGSSMRLYAADHRA
jgi:glycogen operon protein